MTSPVWIAVGLALVLATLVDELRTVLGVGHGSGPMTRLVNGILWRLAARNGVYRSWPAGLLGGERSVITSAGAAASTWERFYFAGYTVVTVGNGSYRPHGAGAELATVVAGFTGMALITLAISYLIQVLGAVVTKRAFASRVRGLGETPMDVVVGVTSGGSSGYSTLSQLAGELTTLAEQHRAYPLLHAFRSRQHPHETAEAAGLLLDAVLVADSLADPACRPPRSLVRSATTAVEQYVAASPRAAGGDPAAALPDTGAADEEPLRVDVTRLAELSTERGDLRRRLGRRVEGNAA